MAIKMKALKSFGFPGANEGKVRRGREFAVATVNRAKDLEANGLAYRIDDPRTKAELSAEVQIDPNLRNEAAEQGPFASAGGETGDQPPAEQVPEGLAQSSPLGHRRRGRRSRG